MHAQRIEFRRHDGADERHQYVRYGQVMEVVLGWNLTVSILISSVTVAINVTLGACARPF
jgi:hypothetical protein